MGYLSDLHAWYVAEYGPDPEGEAPAPEALASDRCPTCGRASTDPLTGACERDGCARDAAARIAGRGAGARRLLLPGDAPAPTPSG